MRANRPAARTLARLVIPAAAFLVPLVVPSHYWYGVLNIALVYAILALGFNYTLGFTGRISLGHIGFWAIGAYASALLTTRLHIPAFLALCAGVASACLVAFVLARLTNSLQAHYLALATLGFGEIVQIVALNWTPVTQGANGVTGIPYFGIFGLSSDTDLSQYYLLLVASIVAALVAHRFASCRSGREAFAMRQSEVAAESLGIRTRRVKTVTLMFSAAYAAVAGSLYAHTYGYISPDVFSFAAMLTVLAMLVIGGQGTIYGPIIGGLLLTFLPEWLRVGDRYWQLLYGIGLFVIVLKMPGGVVGLGRQLRLGRLRALRKPPARREPAVVGRGEEAKQR